MHAQWLCRSSSLWRRGLQPARLLCPQSLTGKNTGVVCSFLLHLRHGGVCMFSHSLVSDSLQPHGLYPTSLLCPWNCRQEYWNGLPFPTPGDLPNSGMEPTSLVSLALAGIFFTTGATWEPKHCNSSQIQTPFWLLGSLCITGLLHTSPCDHSHTYIPPLICLPSPLFTQFSLTIHTSPIILTPSPPFTHFPIKYYRFQSNAFPLANPGLNQIGTVSFQFPYSSYPFLCHRSILHRQPR